MSVYGSKIQDIKCIENLIEYFTRSENGMAKCVSTQKSFHRLWNKKIVVQSKPFIKIIGILILILRFVKSSGQTIIQIKTIQNKIIQIRFLINLRLFTGTNIKPSKMKAFVVLLICGLQLMQKRTPS